MNSHNYSALNYPMAMYNNIGLYSRARLPHFTPGLTIINLDLKQLLDFLLIS